MPSRLDVGFAFMLIGVDVHSCWLIVVFEPSKKSGTSKYCDQRDLPITNRFSTVIESLIINDHLPRLAAWFVALMHPG